MLGWFRKKGAVPVQKAVSSAQAPHAKPTTDQFHWDSPISLPEVTEGNSDADWSAWEESIAFLSNEVAAAPEPPATRDAGHVERTEHSHMHPGPGR